MAAILYTAFLNAFPWTKIIDFSFEFHWGLYRTKQLIIIQQLLGAKQATGHRLTNVEQVHWRIYVSPGLNGLTLTYGFNSQTNVYEYQKLLQTNAPGCVL